MDERTFLNNSAAYSFLTCFLHKVGGHRKCRPGSRFRHQFLCFLNAMFCGAQVQVLSASSCSNLIDVLVSNLLNEQSSLQPELTAAQWAEFSKSSGQLNAVRTHKHTHVRAYRAYVPSPLLSTRTSGFWFCCCPSSLLRPLTRHSAPPCRSCWAAVVSASSSGTHWSWRPRSTRPKVHTHTRTHSHRQF